MKKNKGSAKKGMSKGKMVAVGAGVAALSAGAYYLMGPHSKKHQKKASMLMNKMRKEVMQKVVKAKSMSKPLYHNAVDTLAKEYTKEYKTHGNEIKAIARKLKGEWTSVAKKVAKKSVKIVKKKMK